MKAAEQEYCLIWRAIRFLIIKLQSVGAKTCLDTFEFGRSFVDWIRMQK